MFYFSKFELLLHSVTWLINWLLVWFMGLLFVYFVDQLSIYFQTAVKNRSTF